jgi:UDP-glucuronate 4-epimerase
LGKTAQKNFLPLQDGDVPATSADTAALAAATGFAPATSVASGIARFVDWYRGYYRV